jgi:glycosyltransferase involved in cell wall biosynthesis
MELSIRLVKLGCEVIAFSRPPYADPNITEHCGVRIVPVKAPRSASLELIGHMWSCLRVAKRMGPGIVHLHGIGAALFTRWANRFADGTVVTIHSISHLQDKWGRLAKAVLRRGEQEAALHADALIAVSPLIQNRHPRAALIPNGVSDLFFCRNGGALRPKPYVLTVGRINTDKGFPELIEAWQALPVRIRQTYDLVIVGSPAPLDKVAQRLIQATRRIPSVHLVGGQPLEEVASLVAGASLFVHPSHHEGLPISVIEALAAGVSILTSDLPEILALQSPAIRTFPAREVQALRDGMAWGLDDPVPESIRQTEASRMMTHYDWNALTIKTLEVYRAALSRRSGSRT